MTELKRKSRKFVRMTNILVNEFRLIEKSFISLFIILPNSKIQQLVLVDQIVEESLKILNDIC